MRVLTLFLSAVVLAATPAEAQFRQQAPEQSGFGFTTDLKFELMGGAIGDSIGTGFGASAIAFWEFSDVPARLGAGGGYTRFSTEGPGDAHNKLSLFAMGSWHFQDPNTSVVPYIQGRVGWVRLDDDEITCAGFPDREPPDCDASLVGREWSGLELGAAAGVDIPMTETLNIDVAGTFSWSALGDLTAGSQTIAETSTNVSVFGIRAGVTIFPR